MLSQSRIGRNERLAASQHKVLHGNIISNELHSDVELQQQLLTVYNKVRFPDGVQFKFLYQRLKPLN